MNIYLIILIIFCSCCIVSFICLRKIEENFSTSGYNISDEDNSKFKKGNYESTYGTLEKKGFKKIIQEVQKYKNNKWINDKVFIDLGSGEGKVPIFGFSARVLPFLVSI